MGLENDTLHIGLFFGRNQMKILKRWGPVFFWMGFTFLMSTSTFSAENTSLVVEPIVRFLFPSISPNGLLVVHGAVREMAHLTEYFVLSLLLFRAFNDGSTDGQRWRWALVCLLVVALFAASDEYHQSFVAERSPSVRDVALDTVGGILGLLTISTFYALTRARSVLP